MTIIVVSVSWLMAIISIMFGSYTHIKMFFTLCLSMVLWTPILSIINFLNDLNIQKTFELINANDATLTYANYKDVIQKVTANSNFISYLIMLTPMLAYALAKGSEMGFVSIASSLSQQLAGGARAAGGFATQQALSTSTAISSPDGSMVSSLAAGRREDVYAANVGGSVVSMSNIGTGGGSMLNHTDTTAGGSKGTQNADGLTTSASIAGVTAGQVSSYQKQKLNSLANELNNFAKSEENHSLTSGIDASTGSGANRNTSVGVGKGGGVVAIEDVTHNKQESDTYQTFDRAQVDGGFGVGNSAGKKGGNGTLKAGFVGSAGWVETAEEVLGKSFGVGASGHKEVNFSESDVATLMSDKRFQAAFQDHLAHSKSEGAQKLQSAMNSYTEVNSFAQNIGNDAQALMVQNYKELHGTSQAEALTFFETAAARGDIDTLAKYANMSNNQGINADGLHTPTDKIYFDRSKIAGLYTQNAGIVEAQSQVKQVVDKEGKVHNVQGASLTAAQEFGKKVVGGAGSAMMEVGSKTLETTQGTKRFLDNSGIKSQMYKFGDKLDNASTTYENKSRAIERQNQKGFIGH